ncbi:laccase-15-like [Elaeis guineensis]|uniref:laccase-15-like n=1 Tax=Elaeis guineensis var. tenera TaxID=51953 RepID=UPI003C6DAF41
MAASAYVSTNGIASDSTTITTIIEYINATIGSLTMRPQFSSLPASNDMDSATKFTTKLWSLASKDHLIHVPQTIDERIIITIAVNEILYPNRSCQGPDGNRLATSLNNISFVVPRIDVLEAYYQIIHGVYGIGFPSEPPFYSNFTSDNCPRACCFQRLHESQDLEYNTSVEMVFHEKIFAMVIPRHIYHKSIKIPIFHRILMYFIDLHE